MAATVRDFVTRALRLAGIVAAGESPEAEQVSEALDTAKDMFEEWRDNGLDLGLRGDDLTLDTEPVIDRGTFKAIRYNLAVELANEAGLDVSATTRDIADRARSNLSARLRGTRPVKFDTALIGPRSYNIDEG